MARPRLDDQAERAAYRAELGRVAPLTRRAGFILIVSGFAALLAGRAAQMPGLQWLAAALLIAGWAALISCLVARRRHHKKRMAEPEARPPSEDPS